MLMMIKIMIMMVKIMIRTKWWGPCARAPVTKALIETSRKATVRAVMLH